MVSKEKENIIVQMASGDLRGLPRVVSLSGVESRLFLDVIREKNKKKVRELAIRSLKREMKKEVN